MPSPQTTRAEYYRSELRTRRDWIPFLRAQIERAGTRADLELAGAVAEEGSRKIFLELLRQGPKDAPNGSPDEFLAICGVLGIGRLAARGDEQALTRLRSLASDPRWRVRGAVVMALQRAADADLGLVLEAMREWAQGTPLERRAAIATLCDAKLLRDARVADVALRLVDRITSSLTRETERRNDEFRTLRKALGYCWSVAIVASPERGKPMLEKWAGSADADVLWVVRQNLKKRRLLRLDSAWVESVRGRMEP